MKAFRLKINKFIIIAVTLVIVTCSLVIPDVDIRAASENSDGFGNEKTEDTIKVIIENNTFSAADGAAWVGSRAVDVEYDKDDTAFSLAVKAAEKLGLSCTVQPSAYGGNYISEIGGISELDGGSTSGWMSSINGWFTDSSIESFRISDGSLEAGDIIRVMYSLDYGADIGSDWNVTETTLQSLETDTGTLERKTADDGAEYYVLSLEAGTKEVSLKPIPSNASYQVRIYLNSYAPEEKTAFKPERAIPVKDGDIIYIGVGEPDWPGSYNGLPGTVYRIEIQVEENGTGTGEGSNEGEAFAEFPEKLKDAFDAAGEYILGQKPSAASMTGGEWIIVGLARSGQLSKEAAEAYCRELIETVKQSGSNKINKNKATDNARVVLALTAAGYDAANFAGFDLVEPLFEKEYVERQGINGTLWALIAINSGEYKEKETDDTEKAHLKDAYLKNILELQCDDGGFSLEGDKGDVDVTAIAIMALSHYDDDNLSANAIDKALAFLSANQREDGGFSSFGTANAESTAQVICALYGLGIDAEKDGRFIKNSHTAVDALLGFYLGDGSFSHTAGGAADQMATEQAYLAMTAVSRCCEGKSGIYYMGDMKKNPVPEIRDDEETHNESGQLKNKAFIMMLVTAGVAVVVGAFVGIKVKKGK